MLMKMLEAGGVPVLADAIRQADIDNPNGYYELESVKQFKKVEDAGWEQPPQGKAVKVISELLLHLPAGQRYKVLLVNRDLDEVIASQNKMLERRGHPVENDKDEMMKALFEKHLRLSKAWLREQPNFELLELDHREVLSHPLQQACRIADFVGLALKTEAMADVVDPRLYRSRAAATAKL